MAKKKTEKKTRESPCYAMKNKRHPMWLILFLMTGLAITDFTLFVVLIAGAWSFLTFLLLSILIPVGFFIMGLIVFVKGERTPSKAIGLEKTKKLTIVTWLMTLITTVLLLVLLILFNVFI